MKNIRSFILLSLCTFLLLGCKARDTETNSSMTRKNKDILYIDYIDNINHYLYEFNVNTKKERLIFMKQLEEYPTSSYSPKTQNVYFASKYNESFQLFKENNNNKIKQLTKDLSYVDLLVLNPSEQVIYMRALVNKDDRNFKIAVYDIKNAQYKIINPKDNESSVIAFDYNSKTKELLVVTKSIKEEFENIDKANKNNSSFTPPHFHFSLYTNKGEYKKEVLVLKKIVRSATLSENGKVLLINYKDGLKDNQPSKIVSFNLDDKKTKILMEDTENYTDIRQPIMSKDNRGFYFISDTNGKQSDQILTHINYFDFKTNCVKQIWNKTNGQPVRIYY
ncbi:hypothetical protein [Niallia sp. 01092]|uniref:hypothetical protein n=1 Tax=unclassified Niallia TaxID=2837522 RepID=UPI003FD25F6B